MSTQPSYTLALVASLALLSCDAREGATPRARLNIQVAPLSLPGIGDAEYTIVVKNGDSRVVWSKTVTSDRFGDGAGSIAYVGPCDVQAGMHTVTLTLDKLWDSDMVLLVSPADYRDPGAITLSDIACRENQDVPVIFNLTIMRSAVQGFFDVAVSFKDIFCSAKIDCKEHFLNNGRTRGPTVVMGFACTSGQGATGPDASWLYLSDVTLICVGASNGTQTIHLDEASAPGMQGAAPPYLFDWAQYRGKEELGGIDKCYWNHAFGLDLAVIGDSTCTLSATGTASDTSLVGGAIAADVVWPIVNFQVDVVTAGALCGPNPLEGHESGVWTSYVTPGTTPRPDAFTAAYRCGGDPTPAGFACAGTDASFQPTSVAGSPAVQVTIGGVTSAPFRLPPNSALDETCCLASCCPAP